MGLAEELTIAGEPERRDLGGETGEPVRQRLGPGSRVTKTKPSQTSQRICGRASALRSKHSFFCMIGAPRKLPSRL